MDEFDAKHELIQKLLDMLKGNAVSEVEGHLHPADMAMDKAAPAENETPAEMELHSDDSEMADKPMEDKIDPAAIMADMKAAPKEEDEDNSSAFGMFRKK